MNSSFVAVTSAKKKVYTPLELPEPSDVPGTPSSNADELTTVTYILLRQFLATAMCMHTMFFLG